ncbi:uncharacterized protein LOC135836903 isoform X1 [Planococcus citri]|uniref:uncharacterized protein LOC135836903 isoform X1 n=1 Tax=Planococcus citri TaxID=170843 RepID=UPI0031F7DC0F
MTSPLGSGNCTWLMKTKHFFVQRKMYTIVRFVCVLANLYIFDATNNYSLQSLERFKFNQNQRYYVINLKYQILEHKANLSHKSFALKRKNFTIWQKEREINDSKSKVKQWSILASYTIFKSRVTFYDNLLGEVAFLQICPQLLHTMKDLLNVAARFKKKGPDFYQNIYNDTQKIVGKQRKRIRFAFTRKQTWDIYIHWMVFRLDNSELNNLANSSYSSVSKCFASLQTSFESQKHRTSLKDVISELYSFWEARTSLMTFLSRQFHKWKAIIAEVNADTVHYGDSYFLRRLLPDVKINNEFLSLAIWLMFRINYPEDVELFNEYNCTELADYVYKLNAVLNYAYEMGDAMDSSWSKVNSYLKRFHDTVTIMKEYAFRTLEWDIYWNNVFIGWGTACFQAILDSKPFNKTLHEMYNIGTMSQESKENNLLLV